MYYSNELLWYPGAQHLLVLGCCLARALSPKHTFMYRLSRITYYYDDYYYFNYIYCYCYNGYYSSRDTIRSSLLIKFNVCQSQNVYWFLARAPLIMSDPWRFLVLIARANARLGWLCYLLHNFRIINQCRGLDFDSKHWEPLLPCTFGTVGDMSCEWCERWWGIAEGRHAETWPPTSSFRCRHSHYMHIPIWSMWVQSIVY